MSTPPAAGRKLRADRIGLLLIGSFIVVFFLTRPQPPPAASLNGSYINACCSPILLNNGVLITGNIQVPFKLINMEFGLEAHPTQSVVVGTGNSITKVAESDPAPILFDKDHAGFTLLRGHIAEYNFRRVRPDR